MNHLSTFRIRAHCNRVQMRRPEHRNAGGTERRISVDETEHAMSKETLKDRDWYQWKYDVGDFERYAQQRSTLSGRDASIIHSLRPEPTSQLLLAATLALGEYLNTYCIKSAPNPALLSLQPPSFRPAAIIFSGNHLIILFPLIYICRKSTVFQSASIAAALFRS